MRPARRLRDGRGAARRRRPPGARRRRAHGGRRHVPRRAARRRRPARRCSASTARCRCRRTSTTRLDRPDRYQTVYATEPGLGRRADGRPAPHARAARARSGAVGVAVVPVELVVGLDTFQPVTEPDPLDHRMHSERYRVPEATWDGVPRGRAGSSPSARRACGRWRAPRRPGDLAGRTELFLHRGVDVRRRRRAADQLPPAAHDAADDDRRLRRAALADAVRRRRSPRATASCRSATPCSSTATPADVSVAFRWLAPGDACEIEATDGAARAGVAHTARGTYRTPCFMPVGTRGAVKYLSAADYEALGAEIVLGNTYHLMLRPGADVVARFGGLGALRRLGRPDADRLRRLPGVLARAEGRRRRRHVPQRLRRLDAPPHAGVGGRRPGAARRRHPDGARRVPAAAEPARRRRARRRAHGGVGRRGPAPPTAATASRCSASSRAALDEALRAESARRTVGPRLRRLRHRRAVGGGDPRARCCRRSPPTIAHLPADRPRYLMGVGDPASLVEAVAARRRPVRLRDADPPRPPRHGAHRGRQAAGQGGPPRRRGRAVDAACACAGLRPPQPRATCATSSPSASRRRRGWSACTTWPGRCS